VLYEGKPVGTPDAGAFWRFCAEHGVSTLFTAPTAFRAIRQQDPDGALIGDYDLSKLRTLFLAGERCDPETLRWAEDKLGIPVIDHYWQTETGWPVAANCLGIERFPVKAGSPTRAVPGWDLRVMDTDGDEAPAGEIGALVVKLPMPPGSSPTLWNAEERYRETYLAAFPGYYQTADAGYIDEDGYVFVMARTDDIINTAGHRLSTGAMEEVLAAHPDVAECAVVGVADDLKGQLPVGFLVLKAGVDAPARRDRRGGRPARARPHRPGGGVQVAVVVSACRRRGRGRSSAERCAASPTASRTRHRPRSTTRRSSTRSVMHCARSGTRRFRSPPER
jgi:propionyl-CoA synthetase